MPKVGIVTYFGDNYGACLQAYAVQHTLEALDCETEIINYLPSRGFMRKLKSRICAITNLRQYYKNREIRKSLRTSLISRQLAFKKFVNQYLKTTDIRYFTVSQLREAHLDHDAYTTGSDQLWNPTHHGVNPIYYLDFARPEQKRIAFAPSIARQTIPRWYRARMTEMLKKMDYISVREDVNVETVKQLVPHNPVFHSLDPTLMINSSEWDRLIGEPVYSRPYIFVYLFGDLDYIAETLNVIRDWTGLDVVSLPYNNREVEDYSIIKMYDVGPLEFVNLIRNASLVVTDSFHATAFSINYNKPFYTLLRQNDDNPDNMNSRFYSILKLFNLLDRLVLPKSQINLESWNRIDYNNINTIIESERIATHRYLSSSLGL